MGSPHVRKDEAAGPRPQLPAFCRTRRPTVMVTAHSLNDLRNLVLVMLVLQLTTLLLVIAGPVPPRLSPATATNVFRFRPDAGSAASGLSTVTPISDR